MVDLTVLDLLPPAVKQPSIKRTSKLLGLLKHRPMATEWIA
jgi:hypothetical protein